jgi:hypothetical protein
VQPGTPWGPHFHQYPVTPLFGLEPELIPCRPVVSQAWEEGRSVVLFIEENLSGRIQLFEQVKIGYVAG